MRVTAATTVVQPLCYSLVLSISQGYGVKASYNAGTYIRQADGILASCNQGNS
jgi:hypothetical protein